RTKAKPKRREEKAARPTDCHSSELALPIFRSSPVRRAPTALVAIPVRKFRNRTPVGARPTGDSSFELALPIVARGRGLLQRAVPASRQYPALLFGFRERVLGRDGVAPVAAERAAADANSRGCLAAFVFAAFDEFQHPRDDFPVEAALGDLVHREVFLDESGKNRVENLVGRQGIAVALVRAQFRRRRTLYHARRYDLAY